MSKLVKTFSCIALVSLCTALIAPANAGVVFTLERIDDTHGRLSATGTLGSTAPFANGHLLALTDPFANDPTTSWSDPIFKNGNMRIGSTPVNMAYAASGEFDLFGDLTSALYFGDTDFGSYAPGAAVSGHINLELTNGTTFAAAGTTGLVKWGVMEFAGPQTVGEWIIVNAPAQVPEPASLGLGALALAALVAARRRAHS